MKTMRKLLSMALVIVVASTMTVSLLAASPEPTTAEGILNSDRWVEKNRWDFNGNLNDSVGGATVKPYNDPVFQEPTYNNGKIVLNGHQVYLFETPIEIKFDNQYKYLRVDLKGRLDWTGAPSARRFLGNSQVAEENNMCGVFYANATIAPYNGCSMAIATTSKAHGSFHVNPDQTKFDKTAENLYTFIYFNNHLYYYVNDVLVGDVANTSGGAIVYTDFLGCAFAPNDSKYNTAGEVDYISISMFGPENQSSGSEPQSNPSTGSTLAALPIAGLSVAALIVCKKKKTIA